MYENDESGYFSKKVAELVHVKRDTLRKWSLRLEAELGDDQFKFKRNEQNQRIYFDKDILAFKNLKSLIDNHYSFSDAVEIVAGKMKKGEYCISEKKPIINEIEQLKKELIASLNQYQKELFEQLTTHLVSEIAATLNKNIDQRIEVGVKKVLNQYIESESKITDDYKKGKKNFEIEIKKRDDEVMQKMNDVFNNKEKNKETRLLKKLFYPKN